MDLIESQEWHVRVTFLGPYCIVPHVSRHDPLYLRGSNFLNVHFKKSEGFRPYLRGTLLRSILLRKVEYLIGLERYAEEFRVKPLPFSHSLNCCSGEYLRRDGNEMPAFLRRRSRFDFGRKERCDTLETACPLCLLLGRLDSGKKKGEASLHFGNFNLPDGVFFPDLKDFAVQRVRNRIDLYASKARDYRRVWEANETSCRSYTGTLTFGGEAAQNLPGLKFLLASGFALIGTLAGTTCRVDVLDAQGSIGNHQELIESFLGKALRPVREALPELAESHEPGWIILPEPQTTAIRRCAEAMAEALGGMGKSTYPRIVADVVRNFRRFEPDILNSLPGHTRGGTETLWQRDSEKIRALIIEAWKKCAAHLAWSEFCRRLGLELYIASKTVYREPAERLLGDVRREAQPSRIDLGERLDEIGSLPVVEWIIRGCLRSETPFFFGVEPEEEHTSFCLILTPDGHFRIPQSAIRGALRSQLKDLLEGEGCNAELDSPIPCGCPICQLLSRVTLREMYSDYQLPPEIRHRIRINPHTKTVQESALFDLEVGPQGIDFPFEIRYSSPAGEINPLLGKALALWTRGMLFMGGQQGSGKGRFSLIEPSAWTIELTNRDQLATHLLHRGYFGVDDPLPENLKMAKFELPLLSEEDITWQRIEYTLSFKSPLLSRDPIAALYEEVKGGGAHDTAFTYKDVLKSKDEGGYDRLRLPFLKGEGLRGLLRYAVGKHGRLHDQVHEECACELCRLFGDEHQRGLLLIEDAEPVDPSAMKTKVFDHVAIDRSTGGALDAAKFDDAPLVGTDDHPITFKGIIWARNTLKKEHEEEATIRKMREYLGAVLADLRDGLLAVGGCAAIGYGIAGDLELQTNPLELVLRNKPVEPSRKSERLRLDAGFKAPALDEAAAYYPYYFVVPAKKVPREYDYLSHDRYHIGRYSGKLLCALRTEGPFFIPDTSEPRDRNQHQKYQFLNIDGKPTVAGSEIRGAISSIFEALTNSCFRVLDEERRLSWRMSASYTGNLEHYHPGRVIVETGRWRIEKMKEARLPLYDTSEVFKKIKEPTEADRNIAEASHKIRQTLKDMSPDRREKVLSGIEHVQVKIGRANRKNPNDLIVQEIEWGKDLAYFKIAGPNVLEMKNIKECNLAVIEPVEEVLKGRQGVNLCHEEVAWAVVNKKDRQIPIIKRIGKRESKATEFLMKKRCERVFLALPQKELYDIPLKVRNRYKDLVQTQRDNPQAPPQAFRSLPLSDPSYTGLRHGDLMYFRVDAAGRVADIVPVRISRTMAPHRMSTMLDVSLRPCAVECLQKDDLWSGVSEDTREFQLPHPEGLCPACRVFGTTSYAGRVRFGLARHTGECIWYMGAKDEAGGRGGMLTLPLLESPRPTWPMPGPESVGDEWPQIPGRKFYVHHPASVDLIRDTPPEKSVNNCTIEPLGKGNRFEFEIWFDNLSREELGLLLYSVELEEGLAHKLGKGKPFGLGSVTMAVEGILGRDAQTGELCEDLTREKEDILKAGLRQLESWFIETDRPIGWQELQHVSHLRQLLWLCEAPNVLYPKLREDQEGAGQGGYPTYEDLKDAWGNAYRFKYFTRPWTSWAPLQVHKHNNQRQKPKSFSGKPKNKGPWKKGEPSSSPFDQLAELKNRIGLPEEATNTLFVGGLDYQVVNEDLQGLFAKVGEVKSAIVIMDRQTRRPRFGFVEMATIEQAAKAMELLQGETLKGRRISIKWKTKKERP